MATFIAAANRSGNHENARAFFGTGMFRILFNTDVHDIQDSILSIPVLFLARASSSAHALGDPILL